MWIVLILLLSPLELYKEARKAYDRGDFELAGKKFERFLIKYPNDSLTSLALYWAAQLRRDPERALGYYEKIIAKYPKSESASRALYNLAQYSYAKGEYQEALKIYRKVVSKYPKTDCAQAGGVWIERISSFIFIQLGYFAEHKNAYRLAEKLKEFHRGGGENLNPDAFIIKEQEHYRVWIGIFSSSKEAKNFMLQKGLKGIIKKLK